MIDELTQIHKLIYIENSELIIILGIDRDNFSMI